MAVPTMQRRELFSASKLRLWLAKRGLSLGRPLFAVFLALLAGSVVIMLTSHGSLADRFSSAATAYQDLYVGSFGNLQNISYSLVNVTALIFAGLSVAIAFRAGLFNIGAEGQLAVGALAAGVIGLKLPTWPGWLLVPLMIVASALAGALWGGIVGALKAWRGAHEVVTTIMLNWIAFYVVTYLVDGPLKGPAAEQTLPLPAQATLPGLALFYNQTLGTFLPQIVSPANYSVDVSILFALLALVVYWFVTRRTTFGYELRVIGENARAAKYAGIPVKRNIVLAMALAGAFAGLAGSLHLMGQPPNQLIGNSFNNDSTGFDAIAVALLGRTTSLGILLSALLFGGLQQSASYMELYAHVPGDLVYILQALMLFFIAAEFLPAIRRSLAGLPGLSRKPSLSPAAVSTNALALSAVAEEKPSTEPGQVVDETLHATITPLSQEE